MSETFGLSGRLALAVWAGLVPAILICAAAWADELHLKDGTVVHGTVKKEGSVYSVRRGDGKTERFPGSFVTMWVKGEGLMADERKDEPARGARTDGEPRKETPRPAETRPAAPSRWAAWIDGLSMPARVLLLSGFVVVVYVVLKKTF